MKTFRQKPFSGCRFYCKKRKTLCTSRSWGFMPFYRLPLVKYIFDSVLVYSGGRDWRVTGNLYRNHFSKQQKKKTNTKRKNYYNTTDKYDVYGGREVLCSNQFQFFKSWFYQKLYPAKDWIGPEKQWNSLAEFICNFFFILLLLLFCIFVVVQIIIIIFVCDLDDSVYIHI